GRPGRGALLNRYERPLARDLVSYSISAAPREMAAPAAVARSLAGLLRGDPRRLEHAFATRPRYLMVARRVSPEIAQQVADRSWRGVYLATETRREYLLGAAAAEMLGHT